MQVRPEAIDRSYRRADFQVRLFCAAQHSTDPPSLWRPHDDVRGSAGTDLEVRPTFRPSSRAVFVDHELDECSAKLASRVFVSIRAIRGCQKEPSPQPFTTQRLPLPGPGRYHIVRRDIG